MEKVRSYLKNGGEILDGMSDDDLLAYLDGLTILMAPVYLASSWEDDSGVRVRSRMRASSYADVLPKSGKRADMRKAMLIRMEEHDIDLLSFRACVLNSMRTGVVGSHSLRFERPTILVYAPGIGYHSRLNVTGLRKLWRFIDKICSGTEYDSLDDRLIGRCFFDVKFVRSNTCVRFPEKKDEIVLYIGRNNDEPAFETHSVYINDFSVLEMVVSAFSNFATVGEFVWKKHKKGEDCFSIVKLPKPVFNEVILSQMLRIASDNSSGHIIFNPPEEDVPDLVEVVFNPMEVVD